MLGEESLAALVLRDLNSLSPMFPGNTLVDAAHQRRFQKTCVAKSRGVSCGVNEVGLYPRCRTWKDRGTWVVELRRRALLISLRYFRDYNTETTTRVRDREWSQLVVSRLDKEKACIWRRKGVNPVGYPNHPMQ